MDSGYKVSLTLLHVMTERLLDVMCTVQKALLKRYTIMGMCRYWLDNTCTQSTEMHNFEEHRHH